MQEKKGGIPGRKRFGKGKDRTVRVRKIIADNGKNKKREKIYDIWKVH